MAGSATAIRTRNEPTGSTGAGKPLLLVAILLACGLGTPYPQAVQAQADSVDKAPGTDPAGSHIAVLEGAWIRNNDGSEDPVEKTVNMWRKPEEVAPTMLALATSFRDRMGVLRIRTDGERVLLRNASNENLVFPLGGPAVTDRYGNRHRTSVSAGLLEIETRTEDWLLQEWLLVETLYLQHGQLVRMIEVQNESLPRLRFRTLYERSGCAAPSPELENVDTHRFTRPASILIVPPGRRRELLRGRVEVETLTVDPAIQAVEFFLDGKRRKRIRKSPFKTRIELADPPREQTLEVRGYNSRNGYVGDDRVVLNRIDPPFAVRIGAIVPSNLEPGTGVRVEANITVPRTASLDQVEFYRGDELADSISSFSQRTAPGGLRTVAGNVPFDSVSPEDFVRVTARLADGRTLEDAALIQGAEFSSEIDVQLVELQVLVVDGEGNPVGRLEVADFEIVEDGAQRAVERLRTADDVRLVLGMAIDSSDSMKPVWWQLRTVAEQFLESSLAEKDRAFLVDFDDTIRLLQSPTANKSRLKNRLGRLVPQGGTSLNDGTLFSLLQYRNQPGRRALVVVTDGIDLHSRSRPAQVTDFAERSGIPIYFIDLGRDRISIETKETRDGGGAITSTTRAARSTSDRVRMQRISQRTGGRLFWVDLDLPGPDFVANVHEVFEQIEEDLRHQYVLTYYSSRPHGAAIEPEVRIARKGLLVRSVLPLYGSE